MKKKNREVLRTALNEFRDAYRIFLDDVKKEMEADELGIRGSVSPTSPYSHQEWEIKLDILEETVERVLQDER